jgi:hypothetical protein
MSQDAVATYLGSFIWHSFSGMAAEHGVRLDEPGLRVVPKSTKGRRHA